MSKQTNPSRVLSTPRRAGLALLVIVGLLALFMMIAVSFVITSSAHRQTAFAASRLEQSGDNPDALLKNALLQVVRGTRNPRSVVGPHSLLEDIYGERETIVGAVERVEVVGSEGNYEFIDLRCKSFGPDRVPGAPGDDDGDGIVDNARESFVGAGMGSDDAYLGQIPLPNPPTGSDGIQDNVEGYYSGRVLTMLDGPAKNESTRVVRFFQNQAGEWILRVRPFGNHLKPSADPAQNYYERFVLNGREFNGAGFGYNFAPGTGESSAHLNRNHRSLGVDANTLLDSASFDPSDMTTFPFALLPNAAHPLYRDFLDRNLAGVDADEDYDAPDYQNVALAGEVFLPYRYRPTPTMPVIWQDVWETRLPSFHRPDLVLYWMQALGVNHWTELPINLRRRIILRPDPADHWIGGSTPWQPGFFEWSGNPTFDPVNGPWDVDNDADGDVDSVWVDLGAPVLTGSDGRQFKPLFAILCRDLDGRYNLNVHGNWAHYVGQDALNSARIHIDFLRLNSPTESLMQDRADVGFDRPTENSYATGSVLQRTMYHQTGYPQPRNPPPHGPPQGETFRVGAQLPWVTRYEEEPAGGPFPYWAIPYPTNTTSDYRFNTIGHGFSVAEVNLAAVLPSISLRNPWTESPVHVFGGTRPKTSMNNPYRNLLEGIMYNGENAGSYNRTEGRYGEYVQFNTARGSRYNANRSLVVPRPGRSGVDDNTLAPGPGFTDDEVDFFGINPVSGMRGNKYYEGSFYVRHPTVAVKWIAQGAYGSVPDPLGTMIEAVDLRGMSFPGYRLERYRWTFASSTNFYPEKGDDSFISNTTSAYDPWRHISMVDDPWEIDVSAKASQTELLFIDPATFSGASQVPTPTVPYYGSYANNLSGGGVRHIEKLSQVNPTYNLTFNRDNPFNIEELERLLRTDAANVLGGTGRIQQLVGYTNTLRHMATTESWDLPTPNVTAPPEIRAGLASRYQPASNLSFADLLVGKIASVNAFQSTIGGSPSTTDPKVSAARLMHPTNLQTRGISPDLLLNLRMDINRPFGNGADDNFNGVVDESPDPANWQNLDVDIAAGTGITNPLWKNTPPRPRSGGYEVAQVVGVNSPHFAPGSSGGSPFDYNWSGQVSNFDQSRQHYARNLYVLAMLFVDTGAEQHVRDADPTLYNWPTAVGTGGVRGAGTVMSPNSSGSLERRNLLAYRIAQWAINCADFRDRDSIMSPFEFDLRPFTDDVGNDGITWEVDGLIDASSPDNNAPHRGLVWGMEYPELLITETFACHDKRVADTNREGDFEPNTQGMDATRVGPNPATHDQDYDQVRVPEGTLLVELYATGRNSVPIPDTTPGGQSMAVQAASDLQCLPGELYNTDPWVTHYQTANIHFMTPVDGRIGMLDLTRTVGDNQPPGTTIDPANDWPVWRLAVSQIHRGADYNVQEATIRERLYLDIDRVPQSYSSALNPNDQPLWTSNMRSTFSQWFQPDSLFLDPHPTDPDSLQLNRPFTTTGNVQQSMRLARYVWFTQPPPQVMSDPKHYFYRRPTSLPPVTGTGSNAKQRLLLEPGAYAIIGPHRDEAYDVTTLAWTAPAGDATSASYRPPRISMRAAPPTASSLQVSPIVSLNYTRPNAGTYLNAVQYREMANSQFFVWTNLPSSFTHDIKGPLTIPCANSYSGLNISEPLRGYLSSPNYTLSNQPVVTPVPDTHFGTFDTGGGVTEAQLGGMFVNDPTGPTTLTTQYWFDPPLDHPLDQYNPALGVGGPTQSTLPNGETDLLSPGTSNDDSFIQQGTHLDIRTVFLQRLANPLVPWDMTTNPYLTIDWMPVDLTIYNGQLVWGRPQDGGYGRQQTSEPLKFVRDVNGEGIPLTPRSINYKTIRQGSGFSVTDPAPYTFRFQSRERGPLKFHTGNFATAQQPWYQENPLWAAISVEPQEVLPMTGALAGAENPVGLFAHNLVHTMGYLNSTYGPPLEPTRLRTEYIDRSQPAIVAQYVGAPGGIGPVNNKRFRPFPWLTWNNRPYANAMELMIVPASSPGRFTTEFSYKMQETDARHGNINNPTLLANPYAGNEYASLHPPLWGTVDTNPPFGMGSPPTQPVNSPITWLSPHLHYPLDHSLVLAEQPTQPYGHLLSFFSGSQLPNPGDGGVPWHDPRTARTNLYRMLEYVHVPSRFSGMDDFIRNFDQTTSPPFNRLSRYREPGRVNINTFNGSTTFTDPETQLPSLSRAMHEWGHWGGLSNFMEDWHYSGGLVHRARRVRDIDYITTGIYPTGWLPNFSVARGLFHPNYPSMMNNPFRSFSTPFATPIDTLHASSRAPQNGPPRYDYIDATLLRRREISDFPGLNDGFLPLLVTNHVSATITNQRRSMEDSDMRNGFRDPYFRYQPLIKLGNTLTTRSNVYGVWVTMGYFEVEPIQSRNTQLPGYRSDQPPSPTALNDMTAAMSNPDGYRLVRELGADAGEIKRHRAFMIFDRTLPVAFERGENHNVDKAMLIKRILD